MCGVGGGFATDAGAYALESDTIVNNTATGLPSCTLGGGIASAWDPPFALHPMMNPAGLKNTLVANNTALLGPNIYGMINSEDYNLVKDASDANFVGATEQNVYGQDPNLGRWQITAATPRPMP
jgi:hypothetical protein